MPISRDVKGIWELDSGPAFEGFFELLQRFNCLETGSNRPRDRLKSVCRPDAISRKNTSKRGVFEGREPTWTDFGSLHQLRLLLGRWHSPQVATAAPPAPRVHSSKKFRIRVTTYLWERDMRAPPPTACDDFENNHTRLCRYRLCQANNNSIV